MSTWKALLILTLISAASAKGGQLLQQHLDTKYYKATAIEYGCAAYDRKTGVWNWEKPALTYDDVEDALPNGIVLPTPSRKPNKN